MRVAHLRLFGHPVIEQDGTRAPIGVPPKGIVLLALIAANAARPLSREFLAETLWPALPAADARANLRRHLHLLTKALRERVFLLTPRSVQWNTACKTVTDVVQFDDLAEHDAVGAVEAYGGDLCAGIDDDSLHALRARYRARYDALLSGLLENAQRSRDDDRLERYLARAIADDPLDERAVRALISLRLERGDRAGALREYHALADRLRGELGVEPDAETTQLYGEMTTGDEVPATPNNLRAPATTFVGRERELQALAQALQTHRIVTITGPGGAGKSRLALRCAFTMLSAYADGVWMLELEHASNESEIWERIAEAVDVPGGDRSAVCSRLARGRTLVVLDTCEHVPHAARTIAEELTSRTNATVLATSRRQLHAAGESVIAIGALETETAYRLFLERAIAVNPSFHVEGKHDVLVQELLDHVDRLPLAVELIASRANVLTIDGMQKRLHAAMRIDETIAWSYDLLPDGARAVFQWASVFRTPFTVDDVAGVYDGARSVVEAALSELREASLLSVGVDHGVMRYRLLEMTRTFADRRLDEHGERDAAIRAHAEHFARQADALAALADDAYGRQLDRVVARMPDFLWALEQCARYAWIDCALQLLEGLGRCATRKRFVNELLHAAVCVLNAAHGVQPRLHRLAGMFASLSGKHQMAMQHLQQAREAYETLRDEPRLCDTIGGLAISAYGLGRYDEAERLFIEVRERSERIGDTRLLSKTLGRLGTLYLGRGDFQRAYDLLLVAVPLLRELGELHQFGISLKNLAVAAHYSGNFREAIRLANELLELPGATSDVSLHAMLLCLRGNAERELGDVRAALRSQRAACDLFPQLGDTADYAESVEDIVTTFAAAGEHEAAARLLGYADAVRERIGTPVNPGLRLYYDLTLERLDSALGARAESVRREGRLLTPDDALALMVKTGESLDRRIAQSDPRLAASAAPATLAARGT